MPRTPFKSRMIDEDFNRTWGRLDQPATTVETRRAQVVKPFVERADLLLDLHSMHDDGVPLMLAGPLDQGRRAGQEGRHAGRHHRAMPATPPACACATMAASAIPRAPRTRC